MSDPIKHVLLTERILALCDGLSDLRQGLFDLIALTGKGVLPEGAAGGIIMGVGPVNEVAPPTKGPESYANRIDNLPFSAVLDTDFLESALWIEDTLGLKAHNQLVCMGFETGMTFDPAERNPNSTATGLIQFMEFTATRLGTTIAKLAKMTQVQQMNYVFKYFQEFQKDGHDLSKWNLGDTYMAIFAPPGIGKADDFVVYAESKGRAYAVNKGLDKNKDGMITRGECLARIREVEKIGMERTRAEHFDPQTDAY